MPTQQDLDTVRLNSLLLASTLMQTMRARAEESQKEDNAFKALEAVATTSSKNYKDDATYRYRETHTDVTNKECNFLKTLVHFQQIGLQILKRNQSHIKKLESQLKDQKEVNKALEVSIANEMALQQWVEELERQLQETQQSQQKEREK